MTLRPLLAGLIATILLAAAARADFKVTEREDVIHLTDGSKVIGTVIAEGLKGVVVLVRVKSEDGEKTGAQGGEKTEALDGEKTEALGGGRTGPETKELLIRRADVVRIERGRDVSNRAEGFLTDPVNGLKVVTGRGFREQTDEGAGETAGEGETKTAPKASAGRRAKRPAARRSGKTPRSVDELTPQDLAAIARRNPQAKTMIDALGGPKTALQFIKQNPQMRSQVNQLLQSQGGSRTRHKR